MFLKINLFLVLLSLVLTVFAQNPIRKKFENFPDSTDLELDDETASNAISYRLPNNTKPLRYDLWISTGIHRMEYKFEGNVRILIEVVEETQEIVIHSYNSTIKRISLYDDEGSFLQRSVSFEILEDHDFLKILPSSSLYKGAKYLIDIAYEGNLRNDNLGFYGSEYERNFTYVPIASTQFESHYARHAFPCYDEPWIRTSFDITIRHGATYTVISNMPEISRKVDNNDPEFVITKFETIPPVQSYLVAFVISDYAFAEDKSSSIPFRIYGSKVQIDNGEADFALNVSTKILDALEEYFDLKFPLPKMDQAEIWYFGMTKIFH
jgi:aminopeptidase N